MDDNSEMREKPGQGQLPVFISMQGPKLICCSTVGRATVSGGLSDKVSTASSGSGQDEIMELKGQSLLPNCSYHE